MSKVIEALKTAAFEEGMIIIRRDYNKFFSMLRESKVKKMKKEINEIIDNEFYADYKPIEYKRQYDLHNAYFIFIGKDWSHEVLYSSDYMKGDNKEWVYQNSFIEGYHGGAKNHLWKNPKSNPPFSEYLYEHRNYVDGVAPKYNGDLIGIIDDYVENYDDTEEIVSAYMAIYYDNLERVLDKYF